MRGARDKAVSGLAMGMLALAGAGAVPNAATAAELILDEASGYVIDADVNGARMRLRVDPGAAGAILLNNSAAQAAGLDGRRGTIVAVGPVRLDGRSAATRLTVGGVASTQQLMWFDHDVIADADGVVNPADLHFDRVTFQIRPRGSGERAIGFPVAFDVQRGLYYRFTFGGEILLTRFTLRDPLSTVTAAAGAIIARRRGGLWSSSPYRHNVRFNVSRPVRDMVLERPLSINGLTLASLTVRTSDDAGYFRLPSERRQAPAEDRETDSEESATIVVLGERGRRSPGAPHFWLMVGRGDLERCSSIRYDRSPKRLTLTCSERVEAGTAAP